MATVNNTHGQELVIFAIPEHLAAELEQESAEPKAPNAAAQQAASPKKRGFYSRIMDKQTGKHQRFMRVPRDEYERYFKRDDKGRYVGSEPEGCETSREVLRVCLENEKMQGVGKKDVEAEIVNQWKPINERTGWTHTAVSGQMGMSGGY